MTKQGAGFEYIEWSVKQLAVHNLKPRESVLLLVLGIRAGEDGVSWYGTKTLAMQCSFSRDTLNEAIKGLERHGLLDHHRRAGRSNVYRLLKGARMGVCPGCAASEKRTSHRGPDGKLTGSSVNPSSTSDGKGLTGDPDNRSTGRSDNALTGGSDNQLTGDSVTELPVELKRELQEGTSTTRAPRARGGELSLSTKEQQEAARAWVALHRESWGPGIDEQVAMSAYLAALHRGQEPQTGHVLVLHKLGPDALEDCFEEAA